MRLFLFRVLNFFTNEVVPHIPSFTVRHLWYRRVLGVSVGPQSWIHLNCYFWFYGRGENVRSGASIGESTRINRGCVIDLRGGLRIGDNVSVSAQAAIITASHEMNDPGFKLVDFPVVIEDYAWIGTRAMILPNVRIGRGAVVAAGAVVTRDVPAMAVVAGVPAKAVGTRRPDALNYSGGGGPAALFE